MPRVFGLCGALFGFCAVLLAAGRAHLLARSATPEMLRWFDTALQQGGYHALALLLVAGLADRLPARWARASGWLFLLGIALFSGSLLLRVLTGARWPGVTPLGGLCLLAGWLCLAWAWWTADGPYTESATN